MLPLALFAGAELNGVIFIWADSSPHILFLEGKRCIRVLEEQYIYDVMIGPGLMILIFEHKCFNLVVRYCKYNNVLDPMPTSSISIVRRLKIRR